MSDDAYFNCTDDDGSPCGYASARAYANTFYAGAATDAHYYSFYTSASADTQLTFSPLVDGMTTIGLGFNGVWLDQTSVTASLFDVTNDQLLWGYYWGQTSEGVPLPDLGGFPFSMTQPTALSATHVYRLHLSAESQYPFGWADVNVSGLRVAVPDAGSSMLLFGIGLAGVVAFRSRITHANGPPKCGS